MELFKLFGTIAIDNQKANEGIGETTDKAEKSYPKIGAAFEKIGDAAVKVGKTVAAGLAAGSAAIGALAKQSFDSYAEYEQLVGGIETLFGTRGAKTVEEYAALVGESVDMVAAEFEMLQAAQTTALDNAAKAYQTAGMSANDYMETIASFAASLKQSTASELEAAEVADMAVQDMADNANKMGTSMESIQNAYQGFAKQNYTMLDNLKLGYGGTKEEMQRLLKEASKLSGVKYDINNLSDVYNAIHVIQDELGITGTTANEASETISGSLTATKAAWQNLLTGFADENANISHLMQNLVNSGLTALDNIIPRIEVIFNGIVVALNRIIPVIVARLPGILQQLLPGLIAGATALLNGLIAVMPDILKILIQQVPMIVSQLSAAMKTAFPVLLKTVKELFQQIWDYFAVELLGTEANFEDSMLKIKEFFEDAWAVLEYVWDTVGQPVFDLVNETIDIVREAFAERMPEIKEFVGQCFKDISAFWENNLKPCLEAIGNFIENVLAPVFTEVFTNFIGPAIDEAFNFIKSLWENTLKPVFTGITDFLTGVFTLNFEQAFEGIVSIVDGIFSGIIDVVKHPINQVINLVNSFIKGLNKLEIPDWVPLVGGESLDIPLIPKLEKGGILDKGQIGFLEGNGAEAVVPLDKNQAWISAVARDMEAEGIGGNNQQSQRIVDLLEMLVEMLPDTMKDAFASMKFDVNNREFARLVKAVG